MQYGNGCWKTDPWSQMQSVGLYKVQIGSKTIRFPPHRQSTTCSHTFHTHVFVSLWVWGPRKTEKLQAVEHFLKRFDGTCAPQLLSWLFFCFADVSALPCCRTKSPLNADFNLVSHSALDLSQIEGIHAAHMQTFFFLFLFDRLGTLNLRTSSHC